MRKIIILVLSLVLLASLASAATINVPSQYKTIQKAVNAAKSGDTIYVAAGTYKEKVLVNDKDLIFQGQKVGNTYKYPTVYGFQFSGSADSKTGSGDINGFKITKYGVSYDYGMPGSNTIRNNYFYNCGIEFTGFPCSGNIVMNNKFSGNYDYVGIDLYESQGNIIKGNTFYKSKIGLILGDSSTCTSCTKNTFSSCKIGVQCYGVPDSLIGNIYKGNKKNISILTE